MTWLGRSSSRPLLILRLTWGPETDELTEVTIARSVERASAHVRESSYGKTWLTHETTRWLHAWTEEPRTCDYSQLSTFKRPPRSRVRVRGRVVQWDFVVDSGSGVTRYEVHAGPRVRTVPA